MAVYGLAKNGGATGTNGRIPFTGWTNVLAAGTGVIGSNNGNVHFNGITQQDVLVQRAMRRGGYNRSIRQLLLGVLGQAAGGAVTYTHPRVQGVIMSPGGAIAIEQFVEVNRVTTAADTAAFRTLVGRTNFPATYVTDVSGNGGGGKLSNGRQF